MGWKFCIVFEHIFNNCGKIVTVFFLCEGRCVHVCMIRVVLWLWWWFVKTLLLLWKMCTVYYIVVDIIVIGVITRELIIICEVLLQNISLFLLPLICAYWTCASTISEGFFSGDLCISFMCCYREFPVVVVVCLLKPVVKQYVTISNWWLLHIEAEWCLPRLCWQRAVNQILHCVILKHSLFV